MVSFRSFVNQFLLSVHTAWYENLRCSVLYLDEDSLSQEEMEIKMEEGGSYVYIDLCGDVLVVYS